MRKSAKLITALSVAGLAVAAGSAFTASNTFATNATAPLTGYATTTVSGATVTKLAYNLNASGDSINTASLTLANDTTSSTVQMNFNGTASFPCTGGTATTIDTITTTTYTCTPGAAQLTSALTSTGVVVN